MKIKSIRLNGFLSSGVVELNENEIGDSGLIILGGLNFDRDPIGSNGAGKSTVFDAIYWLLFGETTRGLSGDEVIHWAMKSVRGELTFEVKGILYKITRARGSVTTFQFQYWNGTKWEDDLTHHIKKHTQANIVKVIGNSKIAFQHTSYLCDGMSSRFSSLTDNGRKLLLDEMLEAPPELASALAKVRLDLKTVNDEVDACKRKSGEVEARKYTLTTSITRLAVLISNSNIAIKEEEARLKGDVESLKSELQLLESNLESSLDDRNDLVSDLTDKQEQLAKRDIDFNLAQQFVTLNGASITTLGDSIKNRVCPTCNRPFPEEGIKEKETSLAGLRVESQGLLLQLEKAREAVNLATSDLNNLRSRSATLTNEISNLESSKVKLELQLTQSQSSSLGTLNTQKESLQNEVESTEVLVEELEIEKKGYAKTIADSEVEIETLKILEKAFSPTGIKAMMMDEAIQGLNTVAKEYLSILSRGVMDLEITSTSTLKSGDERSKIGITVNSHGLASFSSGERRRIDLALQIALSEVISGVLGQPRGFLVLDEVVDTLDPDGLTTMIDLLETLSAGRVIFLTTHNPVVTQVIASRSEVRYWTMEKTNGISTLRKN